MKIPSSKPGHANKAEHGTAGDVNEENVICKEWFFLLLVLRSGSLNIYIQHESFISNSFHPVIALTESESWLEPEMKDA